MQEIENIDLVSLIQSHGFPLKKSGSRYARQCPFHHEKTGSFTVYPESNSFYCFGCGAGGDAATFVMKLYGCSFPEALDRLGIEKSDRSWSSEEKAEFNRHRIKRNLVSDFREWESRYSSELGKLICSAYSRLLKIKTDVDLIRHEWIYEFLPGWKYHLDILCYGSDIDKYNLFMEMC